MTVLALAAAVALLAGGIWLSAFFSGSETAFYRISPLRVTVASQQGSEPARRIMRYVRKPAAFVATVLVGNNVANYVVTVAIGLLLAIFVPVRTDAVEIGATMLLAPVIFLLGELVPKNVNFVRPLQSLAANIRLFDAFYLLFRPLSWGLVQLTRFLQADAEISPALGRHQLSDLIERGNTEGVLTEAQVQMGRAMLRNGSEPIGVQVISHDFISGLPATVSRDEAIGHAHRYGITWLALHEPGRPDRWVGSVSIGQLLTSDRQPEELVRPMPRLRAETTRLTASRLIRESGGGFAVVVEDGQYRGLVSLQAVARPLLSVERPRYIRDDEVRVR